MNTLYITELMHKRSWAYITGVSLHTHIGEGFIAPVTVTKAHQRCLQHVSNEQLCNDGVFMHTICAVILGPAALGVRLLSHSTLISPLKRVL